MLNAQCNDNTVIEKKGRGDCPFFQLNIDFMVMVVYNVLLI